MVKGGVEMVCITTETQRMIIDAFFQVAYDNPDKKITVEMISRYAGMTRENIYHNHFKGIKEIIEKIHFLLDIELSNKFKKLVKSEEPDILEFFCKDLLQFFYEKKDWLKVLYGTTVDPSWQNFIQERYSPYIEEYLDKFGKDNLISNYFLAQVIVQEFVSIISIWITDKQPEPPSLFIRKFIFIINQSPVDLLRVE